jgi:hypothetical protein
MELMELAVQKYLRSGKTVEDLEREFMVNDSGDERLAYLSYGIAAPFSEQIPRDCRSLVLERGSWNVVAYTFPKFFNEQEGHSEKLDYSKAKFYEKLDGSLITAFFYDNKWYFSTRKKLLADGGMNETTMTFSDLIDMAIKGGYNETREQFCKRLHPDFTYAFELVAPENRILVRYADRDLRLLACRDITVMAELDIYKSKAHLGGFNLCPIMEGMTREGLDALFATKKSIELEGAVAVDSEFRRVKIKSPAYIADFKCAFAGRTLSTRKAAKLVLEGVSDDIRSIMSDENLNILDSAREAIQKISSMLSSEWERVKGFEGSQKDFYLAVKDGICPDAILVRKRKGTTPDEYLRGSSAEQLLKMIKAIGWNVYEEREKEEVI